MTSERLGTVTTEDGDQCTQGNIGRRPRGKTIKKGTAWSYVHYSEKNIFDIILHLLSCDLFSPHLKHVPHKGQTVAT